MPYTIIIQGISNHNIGHYLGPYSRAVAVGDQKVLGTWDLCSSAYTVGVQPFGRYGAMGHDDFD